MKTEITDSNMATHITKALGNFNMSRSNEIGIVTEVKNEKHLISAHNLVIIMEDGSKFNITIQKV